MFGFGSFPDKAACNSAREHFIKINPHFNVRNVRGELWRAYIQYIDPISKIGCCITYPDIEGAQKSKERMTSKGVFTVYHFVRRGEDAVIFNLLDYKPSIKELLSNDIYGQLVISSYAQKWFDNEFCHRSRENFSQKEIIIQNIYSDYQTYLSRKSIRNKLEKTVGWEGGVYSWHALAQALIKNKVNFQSNVHEPYENLSEIKYHGDNIELISEHCKTTLNQYGFKSIYTSGENGNFLGLVLKASCLPSSGKNIYNPQYRYWLYNDVYRYKELVFSGGSYDKHYTTYQSRCGSCHQRISPHEIDTLIELGDKGPFEICHQCAHEIREEKLREREKMEDEAGTKFNGITEANIFEIIQSGDVLGLISLLSKNPKLVHSVNEDGWMPIHMLASQGEETKRFHFEMAIELLRCGADANSLSPLGWTPIHLIAINGAAESLPIAHLLFKNGADVFATTGDGAANWQTLWQHGQEVYQLFERHAAHRLSAR